MDPLDDIDVINLELALSDLVQIEKRLERLGKGRLNNSWRLNKNPSLMP